MFCHERWRARGLLIALILAFERCLGKDHDTEKDASDGNSERCRVKSEENSSMFFSSIMSEKKRSSLRQGTTEVAPVESLLAKYLLDRLLFRLDHVLNSRALLR
jgi:hypothetical protein